MRFKHKNICELCGRITKIFRTYSTHSKQSPWKPVIGLEIHAQINVDSKLFSRASTSFAAPPNDNVSLFDAALPGTLPVLNKACVEAGVKTALALNCTINRESMFDRKHYFYADLPQGYQITQQRQPLAVNGHVVYDVQRFQQTGRGIDGSKTARISQVQLEQDSGKSIHDEEDQQSLIDLNRAGIGLMEIVTEPDFSNGDDVRDFLYVLRETLKAIKTCSGKMEEGAMRIDANVSVHKEGEPLGVRTEVKNMASIKNVRAAIDYEIKRQIKILKDGGIVQNETRTIDPVSQITVPMRDKEMKQDYRFMPEPNLPPLVLYDNSTIHNAMDPSLVVNIDSIRDAMPLMPREAIAKICSDHKVDLLFAKLLYDIPGFYEYFKEIRIKTPQYSTSLVKFGLVQGLWRNYKERNLTFVNSPMSHEHFTEILEMIQDCTINWEIMNMIVVHYLDKEQISPKQIVSEKDWFQISNKQDLTEVCKRVIQENPRAAQSYRKGKEHLMTKFLMTINDSIDRRGDKKMIKMIVDELLLPADKKK